MVYLMSEEKLTQDELEDELLVSQNKYMICSVCELSISWSHKGDESNMVDHFKEKHGYKDEEE